MSATAHPSTFRHVGHSAPYGVEVSSIMVMVYVGVDQGYLILPQTPHLATYHLPSTDRHCCLLGMRKPCGDCKSADRSGRWVEALPREGLFPASLLLLSAPSITRIPHLVQSSCVSFSRHTFLGCGQTSDELARPPCSA